jgi:hypothetical protein
MAKKRIDGIFECTVCGKGYYSAQHADACRDAHDLLYIPISRSDLNLLINAIYADNSKLIPEKVVNTLQRYAKKAALSGTSSQMP